MYNSLLFINIATCFDHNFGHHQALNEHSEVIKHIRYNTDPYLLTDYCVANMSRDITRERITKLQLWLKRYKEYSQSYKHEKKVEKMDTVLKLAFIHNRMQSINLTVILLYNRSVRNFVGHLVRHSVSHAISHSLGESIKKTIPSPSMTN
jgi:hypothetical protein